MLTNDAIERRRAEPAVRHGAVEPPPQIEDNRFAGVMIGLGWVLVGYGALACACFFAWKLGEIAWTLI